MRFWLSRFSIREVIQHSEWNTGRIWPPHYPKYLKNRSMTKIGETVFRFFSFCSRKNLKISFWNYKGNFFFENRRKNRVENFGFQKKLKNRNFISFLSSGENLEVIHWEIRKLEPIRSSFSHIFFFAFSLSGFPGPTTWLYPLSFRIIIRLYQCLN